MTANPKLTIVRDRKYLDWLRTQPCVICGVSATQYLAVDPAHIGTLGKGIKSSDDEALPIKHDIHVAMHQHGEMSVIKDNMPDWLLREALRAYARQMYREWKAAQ